MRLISAFIQSLYTFGSFTTRVRPSVRSLGIPTNRNLTAAGRWPLIGAFFATQKETMSYPDDRPASEWQAVLNKEQFRVLREKGTEAPFTGEYDKHYPSEGVYECAGCKAPLYKAEHKFKSGCGWPAYFDAIPGAVTRHTDSSWGMERIEIVCTNCGGHLGHVFKGEGYATPTNERHCVNSISLKFSKEDDKAAGEKSSK